MARDHDTLKVFQRSDDLVLAIYRSTRAFPSEERYGQLIRALQALISSLRVPKPAA